jgi:hypothetical protein
VTGSASGRRGELMRLSPPVAAHSICPAVAIRVVTGVTQPQQDN